MNTNGERIMVLSLISIRGRYVIVNINIYSKYMVHSCVFHFDLSIDDCYFFFVSFRFMGGTFSLPARHPTHPPEILTREVVQILLFRLGSQLFGRFLFPHQRVRFLLGCLFDHFLFFLYVILQGKNEFRRKSLIKLIR